MPSRQKTIFLTAAGGSGTIFIIKSLINKYRIIAVDMNKYAGGLYLADKGFLVPSSSDKNYLKTIEQIVESESVDVIIPLIDEELLAMSRYFQNKIRPKVLLPKEGFIELCLNKWNLMNALTKAGIPCPQTHLLCQIADIKQVMFPCIVKPVTARGSRGFQSLNQAGDLENYLLTSAYHKKDLILQERVEGAEFTVSCVVSDEGEVLSVVPKEVILKKGITKIALTRQNEEIIQVCRKVQESFRADGPFNVQLILDKETGLPKIFEINPRFSTTVALTMAAGVDEVDLLIEYLFGNKVPVPKFKKDLVMTRYEEQIYLDHDELKGP